MRHHVLNDLKILEPEPDSRNDPGGNPERDQNVVNREALGHADPRLIGQLGRRHRVAGRKWVIPVYQQIDRLTQQCRRPDSRRPQGRGPLVAVRDDEVVFGQQPRCLAVGDVLIAGAYVHRLLHGRHHPGQQHPCPGWE
ncbi:Uncharacterised protein [Mycobacteroides abscessus subsp. abscessus]|nr:Uncharacterised protein [Mycobacteroides abscessus subsp. abscessus]